METIFDNPTRFSLAYHLSVQDAIDLMNTATTVLVHEDTHGFTVDTGLFLCDGTILKASASNKGDAVFTALHTMIETACSRNLHYTLDEHCMPVGKVLWLPSEHPAKLTFRNMELTPENSQFTDLDTRTMSKYLSATA